MWGSVPYVLWSALLFLPELIWRSLWLISLTLLNSQTFPPSHPCGSGWTLPITTLHNKLFLQLPLIPASAILELSKKYLQISPLEKFRHNRVLRCLEIADFHVTKASSSLFLCCLLLKYFLASYLNATPACFWDDLESQNSTKSFLVQTILLEPYQVLFRSIKQFCYQLQFQETPLRSCFKFEQSEQK